MPRLRLSANPCRWSRRGGVWVGELPVNCEFEWWHRAPAQAGGMPLHPFRTLRAQLGCPAQHRGGALRSAGQAYVILACFSGQAPGGRESQLPASAGLNSHIHIVLKSFTSRGSLVVPSGRNFAPMCCPGPVRRPLWPWVHRLLPGGAPMSPLRDNRFALSFVPPRLRLCSVF